ncbi:hypothetical protein [Saccharothrix sp. Mg75]|uniref:hypothetical protein n=1 Tax=Saccharothrix sp. Mg75 TaxID=3445357 RepID=UPI003EEC8475
MSNADHAEGTAWNEDQGDEHPAGEMALSRRTRAGGRARALAGLTLAVGACSAIAVTSGSFTVSAPGMPC